MNPGKASLTAIIGATGSGKSAWLKRSVLKRIPKRLMVWDSMAEYGHIATPVESLSAGIEQLKLAGASGGFRIVYQPPLSSPSLADIFSVFCRAAFAAGGLTLIVEELANVTRPGYSPPGWLQVVTQGRHRSLSVYGTSQRPQLLDKTFLDQCTTLRVGRLNTDRGRRVLADILALPPSDLDLRPLQWISRDMGTGKLTRETLTF